MKRLSDKKFEAIYNEYYKLVYFIVSKYVGDKFDRENLANDVFIKLYHSRERVDNIKGYLAAAARNAAADFIEKKKQKVLPLDEAKAAVFPDASASSGYNAALEDMKNVLTEYEIEVILSHAVFGESFKEIGKRYDKPLKTVYSVYMRAVQKYRKYKEEKGDEKE